MSNLSEEEIIKILEPMTKDIDCLCEKCPYLNETCEDKNYDCKEKAIQGLLDLYNKEKEKTYNLAKAIKYMGTNPDITEAEIIEMFEKNPVTEEQIEKMNKNYISKDRIRKKIKELEHQDFLKLSLTYCHDTNAKIKIIVLKELLEE